MSRRYELTDNEWERIKKYFPDKEPGTPGRPPKPHLPMVNAIVWIARSGAPWRDLPERYGPWETVYTRFRELINNGVLALMFSELNIDADMQDLSLDSTSVRVHQHGTGAKKGANPPKSDVHVAD
jgi:transposase